MQQIPKPPVLPSIKQPRTLAQAVVEDIVGRIRTLKRAPGDKLPSESAIMKTHRVSRTVVREALSQLQAAGLVQTRHGVGTFVLALPPSGFGINVESVVTVRDVLAVLELRIGLETEAAGLAAKHCSTEHAALLGAALIDSQLALEQDDDSVAADVRFHTVISLATGNPNFVDMLEQLGNALIPRTRLDTPALEADRRVNYLERVSQEHESIYHTILRGDVDGASAAMRLHLSNSRERLREIQRRLESAAR